MPAGEYVFSARLIQGGVAYDGDLCFTVAEATDSLHTEIATWGISERVRDFLDAHGVSTVDWKEATQAPTSNMPLVGNPDTLDRIDLLHTWVQNGGNVVFADFNLFSAYENLLKAIAGEPAHVRMVEGSIYHHDNVCISHPVFDGVHTAGVLEFDKFGSTYPTAILHSVNKPTRTICAALRIDASYSTPGLTYGEYAIGKGKYVVNTFRICENIGQHPYADMLLLNTIKHYDK